MPQPWMSAHLDIELGWTQRDGAELFGAWHPLLPRGGHACACQKGEPNCYDGETWSKKSHRTGKGPIRLPCGDLLSEGVVPITVTDTVTAYSNLTLADGNTVVPSYDQY